jgi:hypothetical protein
MPWEWVRHLPALQGAVKHVSTRSVLNAPLTLTAIVTPVSLLLALFFDPVDRLYLLAIASAPIVWFILQNLYWTFVDPDRLHDEKTQTEWRRIAYGDSGTSGPMIDGPPITNPRLPPASPEEQQP